MTKRLLHLSNVPSLPESSSPKPSYIHWDGVGVMADVPAVLTEPLNRAVGNASVSHQEHAGFGLAVAGSTNPKAMPRRVASGRNVGSVNTFDIRLNP